ncbi:MAG: hypothetical protein LBN03_02090 [Bifidobacteriaceae bacterium]|jgi:hypothetical protein|nr:hypothetical protein [Bifidobacteriaceae bacterium]
MAENKSTKKTTANKSTSEKARVSRNITNSIPLPSEEDFKKTDKSEKVEAKAKSEKPAKKEVKPEPKVEAKSKPKSAKTGDAYPLTLNAYVYVPVVIVLIASLIFSLTTICKYSVFGSNKYETPVKNVALYSTTNYNHFDEETLTNTVMFGSPFVINVDFDTILRPEDTPETVNTIQNKILEIKVVNLNAADDDKMKEQISNLYYNEVDSNKTRTITYNSALYDLMSPGKYEFTLTDPADGKVYATYHFKIVAN